jgi:hypothetical protein
LQHQIELKKLYRMLAEEEEVECMEAIWTEKTRGATSGGIASDLAHAVHATDHSDQVDQDHEG